MSKMTYIQDMDSWTKGFDFFSPVKVRFSETDMFGHLNNTVTFAYFEEARIEYFKSKGFMQDWINPKNETIPVVANLQCDYVKQVFFGEELRIYVKADTIGTSSVDLHYMATRKDGEVCFTGRGTVVQISKKTGRGVPWTEEMKGLFLSNTNVQA